MAIGSGGDRTIGGRVDDEGRASKRKRKRSRMVSQAQSTSRPLRQRMALAKDAKRLERVCDVNGKGRR